MSLAAPCFPYTSSMSQRARILLVEDDARLAQMLEQLLAAEGYDTVLARDGQRALHEGLTHEFDASCSTGGCRCWRGWTCCPVSGAAAS